MEKILQTGEALKKASQERIRKRDEELQNLKQSLMTEYNDKLSSMEKDIKHEKQQRIKLSILVKALLSEMELDYEFEKVDGKTKAILTSTKKSFLGKLKGE